MAKKKLKNYGKDNVKKSHFAIFNTITLLNTIAIVLLGLKVFGVL